MQNALIHRVGVALFVLVTTLSSVMAEESAPTRFGTVYKITGNVVATDGHNPKKRTLKQGDVVYVGEQIRSGANGEAVLRTDDAGVIAVRPNAVFAMEQFSATGNPRDSLTLRIFAGALRLITGWTGRFNKDNHRINTPSGTVGIRGTDHEPYVLSPEMSVELQQPEGTYDKVNKGGTVLRANGGELAIDPGHVGFARAKPLGRTRALMTALLPILLDRVPGFFVAGTFDAELDDLASRSMHDALQSGRLAPTDATEATSTGAPPPVAAQVSATHEAPIPSTPDAMQPADPPGCAVHAIAQTWLSELDAAIFERDAAKFIGKFEPNARISAAVRGADDTLKQLHFTRDELVKSTFAAMAGLSEFASRRPATNAVLGTGSTAARCDHIDIESLVIENGVRNGASYRIESLETFSLVKQSGRWIAVRANTTQH